MTDLSLPDHDMHEKESRGDIIMHIMLVYNRNGEISMHAGLCWIPTKWHPILFSQNTSTYVLYMSMTCT